jgi:hypothetical protein
MLMMKQITSKIQLKRTKKIKIQGFAKSFVSDTVANINSEKSISYRSYTGKQIVDFTSLVIKMVPVKDATSRIASTLSTVYRFQKMWNEYQKVPEKKKRNRAKRMC